MTLADSITEITTPVVRDDGELLLPLADVSNGMLVICADQLVYITIFGEEYAVGGSSDITAILVHGPILLTFSSALHGPVANAALNRVCTDSRREVRVLYGVRVQQPHLYTLLRGCQQQACSYRARRSAVGSGAAPPRQRLMSLG